MSDWWEAPASASPRCGLSHLRLRRPSRWSKTGLVYYLERDDGAVKIGCTHSYARRRDELVARHGRLFLLAAEPGSFDLEAVRHRQFADLRISERAEWFRVGEPLLGHILRVCAVMP